MPNATSPPPTNGETYLIHDALACVLMEVLRLRGIRFRSGSEMLL